MEDLPELADIGDTDLRRKAVEAWAFRSAQAGRGSTLAGSVAPRASRSRTVRAIWRAVGAQANAVALAKVAQDAGMKVTAQETVAPDTDYAALLTRLKEAAPDQLVTVLGGPFTAAFFRAYETSGWKVPVTGRVDFSSAIAAVSPAFRDARGLSDLTGVTVFTPVQNTQGVQDFVAAYQAHYGLVPTQRAFFVYEATNLVVDAIRRAGSDQPAAVEEALKNTTMPSLLGGTYAPDDHNHAHTPLLILGLRDGKPAVIATE
jgi:branched-chain amino acid transport system substrate-binding protein